MSHIPFTLTAYFLNSLAVLSNKFLLNKTIPEPLIYIFYISLVSLPAIVIIPFIRFPQTEVFLMGSFSTMLWISGAYFMFKALKQGQVSRVIPVIGTAVSLILLFFAARVGNISASQISAVLFLIAGMVFLTILNFKGAFNIKELFLELLAASFFAASYLALKEAFTKDYFFEVIISSKLILLPLTAFFLVIPSFRRKILGSQGPKINFLSKTGAIFIGGQLSGLLSELLLVFSISLTVPAFVNSLQGTQYVFLLFFAVLLSKKYPQVFKENNHNFSQMAFKIIGIIFIGIGLYLLAF